jgi:ribosome biogenesis GTPase / thiamine phosphate phosphatase
MKQTFTEQFDSAKQQFLSEGMSIARVISEQKELYMVLLNDTEYKAEVTGHLMYTAASRTDFPAVGDWVAVQIFDDQSPAIIHHILPRKTSLARKAVGKGFEEQMIASNVDIVFIIQSLDGNFNLRRLERYIVVVKESGAVPVILLSKTDLMAPDVSAQKMEEARSAAPGLLIISYSAKTLSHIDEIQSVIAPSTTVCFIGSSGVGKSTLINKLIGEEVLLTKKIRESDSRGRHSTTHRQLLTLANGGFVIDTPGMRELGLWNVGDSSLHEAFPEISALSTECRFNDCTHIHEPDCAVREAVEKGLLNSERYGSYLKLKKESDYVASKTDTLKQLERKAKEKQIGKYRKVVSKIKKKK